MLVVLVGSRIALTRKLNARLANEYMLIHKQKAAGKESKPNTKYGKSD